VSCILWSFIICTLYLILLVEEIGRIRWVGHVARRRNDKCIHNFAGKPEGKIPLGRLRIWENDVKMDVR
jgi:hypothetical protein